MRSSELDGLDFFSVQLLHREAAGDTLQFRGSVSATGTLRHEVSIRSVCLPPYPWPCRGEESGSLRSELLGGRTSLHARCL